MLGWWGRQRALCASEKRRALLQTCGWKLVEPSKAADAPWGRHCLRKFTSEMSHRRCQYKVLKVLKQRWLMARWMAGRATVMPSGYVGLRKVEPALYSEELSWWMAGRDERAVVDWRERPGRWWACQMPLRWEGANTIKAAFAGKPRDSLKWLQELVVENSFPDYFLYFIPL